MDIKHARKLVTNTLDDVQEDAAFGRPVLIATFRASKDREVVEIRVNEDNTFAVRSVATSTSGSGLLNMADAYTRLASFIRKAGLKEEP